MQRPSPPAASPRRHGIGFWQIAGSLLTVMAFSAAPTPLYPLYQQRDHFSIFMVTVVFVVYAVGVIVSLLLAGHVSDWVGRKRILIPAIALEAIASVLFLVWPNLPVLIVARFITGIGVGVIMVAATAHLHELHSRHRPAAAPTRFEVEERLVRPSWRPQRVRAHGNRTQFLIAAGIGFSAFAVLGLLLSLAPGFVGGTLHHPSRLLAGVTVFIVFAAAAISQAATERPRPELRIVVGLAAQAAGLIMVAAGIGDANLAVFLVGGAVGGAGAGILFKSAVGAVAAMAAPAVRGEALAALFLITYLGMIIPPVGMGIATEYVLTTTAMDWFTGLLVALLVALAVLFARTRARQRPVPSAGHPR